MALKLTIIAGADQAFLEGVRIHQEEIHFQDFT